MSIVAMKRKMEAKKNQSVGGNFSLNGRRCGTDVVPQSVKNSKYSNRNHFKTKACFNGEGGVMCERVWDGAKMPGIWENYGGGTATGESLTQEEYIEEKRLKSTQCINLLFTYVNVVFGVTKITVFKDNDSYSITFRGKNYYPRWNHDNTVIANVIAIEAQNVANKTRDDLGHKKDGAVAASAAASAIDNGLSANNVVTAIQAVSVPGTLTGTDAINYQSGIDAVKDAITLSSLLGTAGAAKSDAEAAKDLIIAQHTDAVTYANDPRLTLVEGTIEGISVKGRRVTTVKIGTTDLTFENPEISIFEPVGCIKDIADGGGGSQTGGGTSLNDVGYYGRNKCKVFFVNKEKSFEPLSFGGLGGHLEKLKQPNLDPSYCGV